MANGKAQPMQLADASAFTGHASVAAKARPGDAVPGCLHVDAVLLPASLSLAPLKSAPTAARINRPVCTRSHSLRSLALRLCRAG